MVFTCFLISAALLVLGFLGLVLYRRGRRPRRVISGYHILAGGAFLSAWVLFFPICYEQFEASPPFPQVADALLISMHNAIRLFVVDNDIATVTDFVGADGWLSVGYTLLGAALFVLAPILTVGFILSFFKNLSSYARYLLSFNRVVHVFPCLNEQTVALANSLYAKSVREKRFFRDVIIFTDVIDHEDEETYELIGQAMAIHAILFRKDIASLNLGHRRPRRQEMFFYLIEEDETEKIRHATSIMEDYNFKNVTLYIFSSSVQCRLLFDSRPETNIRVIRINDIRALIYHELNLYGDRLFMNAARYNGNTISAMVIGLGKYGMEVLKTLVWYCQVSGFRLKIRAYEQKADAAESFRAQCPELMALNRNEIEGEAHYDIEIFGGVDATANSFVGELEKVPDATYVFVCLGTDDRNILVSERVRTAYARINPLFKPDIETIVYDSEIKESMGMQWEVGRLEAQDSDEGLTGIRNYKKQAYRIHMMGDLSSFYSYDTLINSKLVNLGMEIHLRYALSCAYTEREKVLGRPLTREEKNELYPAVEATDGKGFWQQDYNYRSSVAKALFENLRARLVELGYLSIPGLDKEWDERTPDECLAIGTVEHVRWNAYMRIDGYCHGPRNDLAKTHPKLVPVTALTEDDLRQDA